MGKVAKLDQIRDGLVTVLKRITHTNGFNTDLKADNIHRHYSDDLFVQTASRAFPRVMLSLDTGTPKVGVDPIEYVTDLAL